MEIVIRATIVFWLLWLVLRASGKRELAQLTPFELIVLMVLGDITQQAVTEEDQSITGSALAVSTMVLWAVAISYLAFRSQLLSKLFESSPTVLIRRGVVDGRALRIQRMTHDELFSEARMAGIGDITDVDLAVLESDGRISFVRRPGKRDDQPPPEAPSLEL